MLLALAAAASLALTACGGSAMNAHDVALANDALQGGSTTNSGSNTPGSTTDPGTGTPGTDNSGTPGNGGGSTGNPGTPGNGGSTGNPGTSGNGGGGGGGGNGGGAPATGAGVKAGSCANFNNNQTGINSSTITLANVADVSGPVPGFFTPAQLAAKAYVQYFNSTSKICGHSLALMPLDSQTNASGDQVAWQKACEGAFAGVGSMSAFDSGGAATTQHCGIPDLRAVQTNAARTACTTCFAAEGAGNGLFNTAIPDYFLKHDRDPTQHAAMFYVGEAASVSNAQDQVRAETTAGWKFVYSAQFDIAEFNYAPYVAQMKAKGVKLVQFYGASSMAVRFAQALQSADFHPQLMFNAAMYDKTYAAGGSAVEGTILYIDFTPLEDMATNPEMRLYNQWLQQVSPGSKMSYFGLFAWSATRLAVEQMVKLGGKLNRASMIASIKSVHNWTSNGLHPAMDVGGKRPSSCWRFVQLHNGVWRHYGNGYTCGRTIKSH